MSTIMPAFDKFHQEGVIVGRLLVSYGELELGLCFCVAEAKNDFNGTFKAMFRPRGETARIDIADALGRESYRAARLGTHFEEAIAATRYCLKVRNQYAHCYWTDKFGKGLFFLDVEDLADRNTPVDQGMLLPEAQEIDLPTLEAQEAFFNFVDQCLTFLHHEYRVRAGRLSSHPFSMPKKVQRPPLRKP